MGCSTELRMLIETRRVRRNIIEHEVGIVLLAALAVHVWRRAGHVYRIAPRIVVIRCPSPSVDVSYQAYDLCSTQFNIRDHLTFTNFQ